jgi:hypothetical protein
MREKLILKVLQQSSHQRDVAADAGYKAAPLRVNIKGTLSINNEGILMLLTGDICKLTPSLLYI